MDDKCQIYMKQTLIPPAR